MFVISSGIVTRLSYATCAFLDAKYVGLEMDNVNFRNRNRWFTLTMVSKLVYHDINIFRILNIMVHAMFSGA